jgi:hypothetical protein
MGEEGRKRRGGGERKRKGTRREERIKRTEGKRRERFLPLPHASSHIWSPNSSALPFLRKRREDTLSYNSYR